jgi:ActR/RegA family two-component response regulator
VKLIDKDLEVGTDDGLVMIASLQVDTIDYKKVVIEGNESEAVAVPAFQGQSH